LIAAKATFALNPGLWLRRDRLDMLPPTTRHRCRNQAGIPLIGLFRFAQPPLRLVAGDPLFRDEKEFMPLQAADLHVGWVRRLDAADLLGEPIPTPLWGPVGDSLKRINWVMTDAEMEYLSGALLGLPRL
jgi:hypothetical protein